MPFTLAVVAFDGGTWLFFNATCAVNEDPTRRIAAVCPDSVLRINMTLSIPLVAAVLTVGCAVVARTRCGWWVFTTGALIGLLAGIYLWAAYA